VRCKEKVFVYLKYQNKYRDNPFSGKYICDEQTLSRINQKIREKSIYTISPLINKLHKLALWPLKSKPLLKSLWLTKMVKHIEAII
jgi:hypothetical protein